MIQSYASIQANSKNLLPDNLPRTIAVWKNALDDLLGYELIEESDGYDGEVFLLTARGYKIADILKEMD